MRLRKRVTSASSYRSSASSTAFDRDDADRTSIASSTDISRHLVTVDPDEIVYKTSSMALLRSKKKAKKFNMVSGSVKTDTMTTETSRSLFSFMFNMWKGQKFCDIILRHRSGEIYAHKLVFAFHSDSLASKLSEFPPEETVALDVSDFRKEIVSAVTHYLYTFDLHLTDSNVGRVLLCATELEIDSIVNLCLDFLRNYDVNTALHFVSIATSARRKDIEVDIKEFIWKNISAIIATKSFLRLSFEKILTLLSEDGLYMVDELVVFRAVVRWVDYKREDRLPLAHILLNCVRFQHIAPEILATKVEIVKWIFKPRECYAILCEAYKYHALKGTNSSLLTTFPSQKRRHSASKQPTTYRTSMHYVVEKGSRRSSAKSISQVETTPAAQAQTLMLVSGGLDLESQDPDSPGRAVLLYDVTVNTWRGLTQLPDYTHHHGAVVLQDKLYIVGGAHYDVTNPILLGGATDSVHIYDVMNGTWSSSQMVEKRAFHSVVTWNDSILAIGGENDNDGLLDTIERFDVQSNTWNILTHMPPGGGRIGCACAVYGDLLFIAGGYNAASTDVPVLDSLVCYDLVNQRWLFRKSLPMAVCHASMAVVMGRLLLVGGRTRNVDTDNEVVSVASILEYDAITDSWFEMASLETPRHDAAVAVMGSRVYVIGGMTSPTSECLSDVECIDLAQAERITDVAPLPHPAMGHSCCLMNTASVLA